MKAVSEVNVVRPELTAVIVNYNAGAELRQALQSIAGDSGPAGWDAVIVDNASSDGSADIALEFPDRATLIRNTRTSGLAAPSTRPWPWCARHSC